MMAARERFDGAVLARSIASTFFPRVGRRCRPGSRWPSPSNSLRSRESRRSGTHSRDGYPPPRLQPTFAFGASRRRHVCRSSTARRRPRRAVRPHLAAWGAVAMTAPVRQPGAGTQGASPVERARGCSRQRRQPGKGAINEESKYALGQFLEAKRVATRLARSGDLIAARIVGPHRKLFV